MKGANIAKMKKFLFFLLLLFPSHVLAADAMLMADVFRHPIVEGLLSAVILISLLAEIKTAGFSGGALAAAIAGCLLIGANWSEGNQMLEAVLYFGGLTLVILDILALMTGVAAVIGLVLLLSGLFFTFGGDMTALYILSVGVLLAGVGFYFLVDHLSQSRLWQKITLRDSLTVQKGFKSSAADLSAYAGKEGISDSVLRPSGKVDIEGHILDAVSRGDFIEKGEKVIVIKADGSYLVVKKADAR